MRKRFLGATAVGAVALLVSTSAAASTVDIPTEQRLPEPFTVDSPALERMAQARADKGIERKGRLEARAGLPAPAKVQENEPNGQKGANDTLAKAQRIADFGSARRDNPRARVTGSLAPQDLRFEDLAPSEEDDGAIPLARDTGIGPDRTGIRTTGKVGDGPHGSAGDKTGDFDFYRIDAEAGQVLTADVEGSQGLSPALVLHDESGQIVTGAYDLSGTGVATAHLSYLVPRTGAYYLVVTSPAPAPYQGNPFESGTGFGVGSEGDYALEASVSDADVDMFAVDLRPGDVLGATVRGAAHRLAVFAPDGTPVQGAAIDMSGIYPAASPLPGGGNATVDHVAATRGRHYIAVADGEGEYDATVEVYRTPGEKERKPQTIFLDFDGARINNNIFPGMTPTPGVVELSPLSAFLERWGLTPADEPALVKAITRTVRENLERDIRAKGNNRRMNVRVLNSLQHRDPFGQENVSRVIVGGTIEEAGISPVVGIAQSVDPGNFARNETALVLLDQMSDPADNPISLNAYLTEDSDRIAALGRAIGNVVSHEAGHYLGNWHTDSLDGVANLMDTGQLFDLYGLGPDRIAGTADDIDTDFAVSVFDPLQGFTGLEDNVNRTAFGLSTWRLHH